jgi:hypothetical protein
MEIQTMVDQLNDLPSIHLDDATRDRVFQLIAALGEAFQKADIDSRRCVTTTNLTSAAKYAMGEYTIEKAVEGLRTGSPDAILDGLIPVVMAGGNAHRPTRAMLLSLVLHSAEKAGLNSRELFVYAADLMFDEAQAARVRGFPDAPGHTIACWGYSEHKIPEGLTYRRAAEAPDRLTWWDRHVLGKRVDRATQLRLLRDWHISITRKEQAARRKQKGSE